MSRKDPSPGVVKICYGWEAEEEERGSPDPLPPPLHFGQKIGVLRVKSIGGAGFFLRSGPHPPGGRGSSQPIDPASKKGRIFFSKMWSVVPASQLFWDHFDPPPLAKKKPGGSPPFSLSIRSLLGWFDRFTRNKKKRISFPFLPDRKLHFVRTFRKWCDSGGAYNQWHLIFLLVCLCKHRTVRFSCLTRRCGGRRCFSLHIRTLNNEPK